MNPVHPLNPHLFFFFLFPSQVHMGTHMWTSSAQSSRRGRRMSLELPANIPPIPMNAKDSDFLQRRPDLFYPYLQTQFSKHQQQQAASSAQAATNGTRPVRGQYKWKK